VRRPEQDYLLFSENIACILRKIVVTSEKSAVVLKK
jgi:hypothetical protein